MTVFQTIAILITLTALFSYVNFRYFKLPTTIGVMLIALICSLGLIAAGHFVPGVADYAKEFLAQVDFDETLMKGMLCFLLFAGALHIDISDLSAEKLIISVLALVGVSISIFVFGTAIFYVTNWLGLSLSYVWCLLFGTLISPTDPIAVLGILKSAKVPKSLETQIAGESLFNDGIGIVAFTVLYEIAVQQHPASVPHIGLLFVKEALGGIAFGLILGWITYKLLKTVNNYTVEILLTLALVMGGYTLATSIHTSGPIAIVVAGLLIGNHGRQFAMSERTRNHLDTFWELNDEILNAILFVLIGMEVLVLTVTRNLFFAGLIAIPVILTARWISVGIPLMMIPGRELPKGTVPIMAWGGLRGGISVALALSLPVGPERDIILAITYIVVVFSILVQGLTVGPLVKHMMKRNPKLAHGAF